jgi:hypothetical protein
MSDLETLAAQVATLQRQVERLSRGGQPGRTPATTMFVRQSAHGFVAKDVLRHNGASWVKAQANTSANAVVGGIVLAVLNSSEFVLGTSGYIAGLSGLTAGSVHYLSATTAGALTTTAPSIICPVIIADTSSSGVILGSVSQPAGYATRGTVATSTWTTLSGSSTAISGKGWTRFVIIAGGGGNGGNYTTQTLLGYIAPTSGGSPTTYLGIQSNGGRGASGGWAIVDADLTGKSSISHSIGSAGTQGTNGTPGTAGGAGGNTTLTVQTGQTVTVYGGGGGGAASATQGGAGGSLNGGGVAGGGSIVDIIAGGPGRPGQGGGIDFRTTGGGIVWREGQDGLNAASAGLEAASAGAGSSTTTGTAGIILMS